MESAERFALFWTSAVVPPFHRLSHHHPHLTALSLAISFVGPSPAFPLSSRKKFFYNFRIVLFRSSRFFQPRAGRSPRADFTPPSSAVLPTPPTSVCVFPFSFSPRSTLLMLSCIPSRSFSCPCHSVSVFTFGKLYQERRLGAVLIK